ncbi:MAG: Ig-like domain-containing protein [Nitrososphaera sp.]
MSTSGIDRTPAIPNRNTRTKRDLLEDMLSITICILLLLWLPLPPVGDLFFDPGLWPSDQSDDSLDGTSSGSNEQETNVPYNQSDNRSYAKVNVFKANFEDAQDPGTNDGSAVLVIGGSSDEKSGSGSGNDRDDEQQVEADNNSSQSNHKNDNDSGDDDAGIGETDDEDDTVSAEVSEVADDDISFNEGVANQSYTENDNGTDANWNYTTSEDESIQIPLSQDAHEGSPISFSNMTQPLHGSIVIGPDNAVTYLPDPNYNGPDSFIVTTSSGNQTTSHTVTITVTPSNDPPVALNYTVTTTEETPVLLTLVNGTSDLDGDVSYLTITRPPDNGVIVIGDDNRTVTYIPNENFEGIDSFEYLIADSTFNSTGTIGITVTEENDGLWIISGVLDSVSLNEDSSTNIDILSNVFDPDGDSLTITSLTQPSNGVAVLNPDNTVTYIPTADFYGQDSFSFTVTGADGESISGTVDITINPVNDVPLTEDMTVMLDEDESAEIQLINIDVDQDSITYLIVSPPEHGIVTIVDGSGGILQYTPHSNYFGSDTFSFQTSDGISSSTISTVDLIINSVNDEPIAIDSMVVTDANNAIIIDVIAYDVEDDILTTEISEQPEHGTAVVDDSGTIIYSPEPGFNGTDSFTYTVSDGSGGSDSATVTITVGPENDTPVSENGDVSLDEDQSIDILLNATDGEGDTLGFEVVFLPSHGVIEIISGDGSIVRYTPTENYYGDDSFSFRASDSLSNGNIATVLLTVNGVNDQPAVNNDSYMIYEDNPLRENVLANDYDVDSDNLSVTLVEGSSDLQGTVTLDPDGTLVYTPEDDYYGTGSLQYVISDGNGEEAIGTVTITVVNLDDPPVANEDLVYTIRNQPVLVRVLENDADPDSSSLIVGSLGVPSEGSVKKSSDGKGVIYKPKPGFYGTDLFTYNVTDGKNSVQVTVTVHVFKYNFWQEKQMLGMLDDEFEQGTDVSIEFKLKDLTNHNDDQNLESPPVILRIQQVDSNNLPIGPVMDAAPSSGLYDGNQFNSRKSLYTYSMDTQNLEPGNWALYLYMLENSSSPAPEVLLESGPIDGITAIITIT